MATINQVNNYVRSNAVALCNLYLYVAILILALIYLPNRIFDSASQEVLVALGVIGTWRYGWWFMHVVRAQIYARIVFPKKRRTAEAIWKAGWRPNHLYFMLTTYGEEPDTTKRAFDSIVDEIEDVGVSASIYIGTGKVKDERIIQEHLSLITTNVPIEIKFIRQNQPGKRFAIGLVLRALSRRSIKMHDPVVFMDGDCIMEPGTLRKCLPMFELNHNLQALTTDERAIVFGPTWIQDWLDMRFAQRHLGMQSHSLSNKVLTLTGRMSVFRGKHIVSQEFIRMVEADHLEHWLWGQFRFLSGDDKSTWYCLLKHKVDMLYVPDAVIYTVEYIEGSAVDRMKANLLRWSGNMLRNGSRALRLGPRHIGWFIWLCILDQRISIWTTLVAPIATIAASIMISPKFIIVYLIWIALSRLVMSLFLFAYAKRITVMFPLLLYVNQLANSVVKVYVLFRLPKQGWKNRGNQKAQLGNGWLFRFQNYMALYLTGLFVSVFSFIVIIYIGLLEVPSLQSVRSILKVY